MVPGEEIRILVVMNSIFISIIQHISDVAPPVQRRAGDIEISNAGELPYAVRSSMDGETSASAVQSCSVHHAVQ